MRYTQLICTNEEQAATAMREQGATMSAAYFAFGEQYNDKIQSGDVLRLEERLSDYGLYHAARADLLRRAGDVSGAADSYQRALDLCQNQVERHYLLRPLREAEAKSAPEIETNAPRSIV